MACDTEDAMVKYFTINANHVGDIFLDDSVTALTFSCAPEGRNINVVAVAVTSSQIRYLLVSCNVIGQATVVDKYGPV